MKNVKFIFALAALAAIILVGKCKKEEPPALYGNISVVLDEKSGPDDTAPDAGDLTSLILDVRSVDVLHSHTPEDRWIPLKTREGLYDLIQLKADSTATLAAQSMAEGRISAMRLVLGDMNSVIVRGDRERTLLIPPNLREGIVFETDAEVVTRGHLLAIISFNARQSVVKSGENYMLVPKTGVKFIMK